MCTHETYAATDPRFPAKILRGDSSESPATEIKTEAGFGASVKQTRFRSCVGFGPRIPHPRLSIVAVAGIDFASGDETPGNQCRVRSRIRRRTIPRAVPRNYRLHSPIAMHAHSRICGSRVNVQHISIVPPQISISRAGRGEGRDGETGRLRLRGCENAGLTDSAFVSGKRKRRGGVFCILYFRRTVAGRC